MDLAEDTGVADDPKDRNEIRRIGIFMTVPFVLAIPPIVGWFLGHWLDQMAETTPLLTYLLLLLGFIAGVREFYRIIKKYGNDS